MHRVALLNGQLPEKCTAIGEGIPWQRWQGAHLLLRSLQGKWKAPFSLIILPIP